MKTFLKKLRAHLDRAMRGRARPHCISRTRLGLETLEGRELPSSVSVLGNVAGDAAVTAIHNAPVNQAPPVTSNVPASQVSAIHNAPVNQVQPMNVSTPMPWYNAAAEGAGLGGRVFNMHDWRGVLNDPLTISTQTFVNWTSPVSTITGSELIGGVSYDFQGWAVWNGNGYNVMLAGSGEVYEGTITLDNPNETNFQPQGMQMTLAGYAGWDGPLNDLAGGHTY